MCPFFASLLTWYYDTQYAHFESLYLESLRNHAPEDVQDNLNGKTQFYFDAMTQSRSCLTTRDK